MTERPQVAIINEDWQLHCEEGPALAYKDQLKIYAWQGTTLPKSHEWIIKEKNSVTLEAIDRELDKDLSKIMLQIYGIENYLKKQPSHTLLEDTIIGQKRTFSSVGNNNFKLLEIYYSPNKKDISKRSFVLQDHRKLSSIDEALSALRTRTGFTDFEETGHKKRKINTIQNQQLYHLNKIREEWSNIGYLTEPANREMAEQGVDIAYQEAGLKPPDIKIWFDSPSEGFQCAIFWRCLRETVTKQVIDQILEYIDFQAFITLEDHIRGQLDALFLDETPLHKWQAIRDEFTKNAIRISSIGKQGLGELLGDHDDEVQVHINGQHDSWWLAWYDAVHSLAPEIPKPSGIMQVAKNCGVWWPFENAVILCERPYKHERDNSAHLHCEDGPAIAYPLDSSVIYAWRGYILPESHHWIITDKSRLTPEIIDDEFNAELTCIMLEIYGFKKYLDQRPYRILDEDIHLGQPRRLIEVETNIRTIKLLDIYNGSLEPDGSRRRFFLYALNPATTVHEAVAMSYGIEPEFYREGIRT